MGRSSCVVAVLVAMVLWATPAAARDHGDAIRITVPENSPDRILISYELKDFTFGAVEIDGRSYATVSLGDEALILDKGSPALPHVNRSIIIPDDAEMVVRVVSEQHQDCPGMDVAPSKGDLLRTVDPDTVPYTFGQAYQVDADYPGQVAALGEPYILRDYRGLVVTFNPFQYNALRRTLRVYTNVVLEVSQSGPGHINVLDRGTRSGNLSLAFHQLYKHQFLNYSCPDRYAPLDEVGSMLIIYYDSWAANVQPLVDHKNSIGISTTAVPVSTAGSNATQIKNYLQNVYNSSDLAFALLVGDSAQVPTPSASGGSSDPTYSKLAGGDNYPDIMVGRFSAETSAQVDTQVQRTITYETMPATTQDWFWRGTGIASNQGSGQGDEGQADNVHMDEIRSWLLAHGYTLVDQIYDPSANATMVANALNAGRGIVNYCGHGSVTSWSSSGFSSTHVNQLVNDNMLPFIVSVACVNGQFAGTTCFAEAWLRATHNGVPTGAIATYMSSINQSWAPPMEGQDEFNILYCAEEYVSFGTLCFGGSCSMMDAYGSGGVSMFDTWNVFGDPSVRIIGVAEPPTGLKVAPSTALDAAGPIGGPFTPASLIYVLENKNETPLQYQVSCTTPWITVTNGSGTLPALGSTNVTVAINAAANALPQGSYGAVVDFANLTDHDGDTTRDAHLAVGGPAWNPVAYNMQLLLPRSAPSDVALQGSDPNGDALTYIIESLPLPGKGILVDPDGGQITTAPYTLIDGGTVTYIPPYGLSLTTSFQFSVRDASAGSNVATVAITVGENIPQQAHFFPLDANPGWTTEGAWAYGRPTGGGTHNYDPIEGHTNLYVYGYNLYGDYTNNMPVRRLTTTAINCKNLTNTQLRFWRWLGVEEDYDGATVDVSNDGTNWTTVWNHSTTRIADSTWTQMSLDVSAVADGHETVFIRWSMGATDYSVTYPGWNIDDVEIWAIINFTCEGILPGDVSGDGALNGLDVAPFVDVLMDPYAAAVGVEEFCAADLNADGFVTIDDVDDLVQAMLNP